MLQMVIYVRNLVAFLKAKEAMLNKVQHQKWVFWE